MAKSSPFHPTPRAVSLLKSLVPSMAVPALQSSLKRKTGAWEPNRGINTHHFSALNAPLSAIHQPLTGLFTPQSGLCLAAQYTSKCSFDTLSLSPCPIPSASPWFWPVHGNSKTVWPVYGWCSTTKGLSRLRWECHTMPGWWDTLQLQKHSNSKTKTYKLSTLWLDVFVSL